MIPDIFKGSLLFLSLQLGIIRGNAQDAAASHRRVRNRSRFNQTRTNHIQAIIQAPNFVVRFQPPRVL